MKIRRFLLMLLPVLLIGGVIHHASLHAPTGPAEGIGVDGQLSDQPSGRQTIRVATFNIHAGKGRDGRRDIGRVAECLERLDFVALNEVRGPRTFERTDQAEVLGRRLKMGWLFAPTVRRWYHLESGNGLLTTLPVGSWQRIPLIRKVDHSHRNAVLVDLRQGGQTVRVLLTHINRRHDVERKAQLRTVIALYLALAEPCVLLGDLNSTAEDPQIGRLLATPGVLDPVGEILGDEAPPRIDWILARGFRCIDAGIRDNGSSDHPMIWAELELIQ